MRNSAFLDETVNWVKRTAAIKSAVLFGSAASNIDSSDRFINLLSDLDLHLIVTDDFSVKALDWSSAFANDQFYFQAVRPATGGVRKVTVIFDSGQIDMVLVPIRKMRLARLGLRLGLYDRYRGFRVALDEMATCLHSGYRFLKGEGRWKSFYDRVCVLSGMRLNDEEMRNLADTSICDVLWVLQKLKKGELVAAQHVLHTKLSDTNLRLWRELRRRRDLPLPSFGLGRRVEVLASEGERAWLSVSARLNAKELGDATWKTLQNLKSLMTQLEPTWRVSTSMESLFLRYR